MRQYRTLKPALADQATPGNSSNTAETKPEQKRRESKSTKGKVACESCRSRKIACDCARPTCRQCQKRKIECVYKLQGMRAIQQRFDDNSRETRTFLNRLLSATDEEALGIIRHLRSNPNLASAICFADSRQTSFDRAVYSKSAFQSNDHEPSMRSSQSMEPSLATMYPLSYPTLTPIDVQHASVLKHKPFGNSPTSQTGYPTSLHDNQYCDTRLNNLQISNWTTVQVSNEFAAQVLSLYLTRDHPCMPFFDSELFLDDLVNQKTRYCSSFLVNAVLCLGCQAYSPSRRDAQGLTSAFFEAAAMLWNAERTAGTSLVLAASQCFSLACLFLGKDTLSRELMSAGRQMALDLHLIDVPADSPTTLYLRQLPPLDLRSLSHIAWGAFNWFTLLVFHYGDVPVAIPPIFPLPEQSAGDEATSPLSQSPSHKLDLFPENCKYFIICCEIAKTCYRSGKSDHDMPTLALAGDQYKKLLSWFEKVPPKLSSKDYQDNRIVLLHCWFYSTILDLFRPFMPHQGAQEAPTAAGSPLAYSPREIFSATLAQLKHLVLKYCLTQDPSQYSPFIGSSMMQVIGGMLKEPLDQDWRPCLLIFLSRWKYLQAGYPLYTEMAQAALSMFLQHGLLSGPEANVLMRQIHEGAELQYLPPNQSSETRLVVDYDRALHDLAGARIANLITEFHGLNLLQEFTINQDYEAGAI